MLPSTTRSYLTDFWSLTNTTTGISLAAGTVVSYRITALVGAAETLPSAGTAWVQMAQAGAFNLNSIGPPGLLP